MPATIHIDDDVFALAEQVAKRSNLTVGEVVSRISRDHFSANHASRNRSGFPLLPQREGSGPVTAEMIRQIEEDSFWEEYLQKEANSR